MTECEAVKKLRAYLKCKEMEVKGIYEVCNNERCDDCDLCYMQGTTGEHMTAIGIAIQTLEKQIPKKPTYEVDETFVLDGWICPCCRTSYEVDYDYCPNCGQKIDWSNK